MIMLFHTMSFVNDSLRLRLNYNCEWLWKQQFSVASIAQLIRPLKGKLAGRVLYFQYY